MKVCMLTTSYPTYEGHPKATFIYFLSKALSKKTEVDIVCPYSSGSKNDFKDIKVHRFKYWITSKQTLTEKGGIPSELRRSWYSRLQFIPFCFFYMLKIMKVAKNCDIIHANWVLTAALALPTKWIFKKKIVLNERGSNMNMLNNNILGKFILFFIVNNVDYVVTNNKHQVEFLDKFNIKKKLIYNGIMVVNEFKEIHKNGKIVLFVGNLVKEKGVVDLVEALAEIRGDLECYFIGEGHMKHILEEKCKILGVRAKFFGSIPFTDVSNYYHIADVLVLPSWAEGRPNVLVEAMAYSVPVVAYDIPGSREIIKNGYNGVLVNLKDVNALSKAIENVLKDKKLNDQIRKNAVLWFKKNAHTWEKAANEFLKVYKEVL